MTFLANDIKSSIELTNYMLKETDYDGGIFYSDEITVRNEAIEFNLSAYPCPAKSGEILNVIFDKKHRDAILLKITDLTGKVIVEDKLMPEQSHLPLPLTQLGPGLYFLSATDSLGCQTVKFIVK